MSTNLNTEPQTPSPIESPLSMAELAAVLVKHYGLSKGLFDVMVEYQIGTGKAGPDKDSVVPSVMVGAVRIGLIPATTIGPTTVDAELLAPKKNRRKGDKSK